MLHIKKNFVTMGDHEITLYDSFIEERSATGDISTSETNSGTEEISDSESSDASWLIYDGCENLNCNIPDRSNISEANSEVINWIVREYWKSLTSGADVKTSHKSELDLIEKRIKLFIGDRAEKHVALHKLCARLAECYYMELRHELEDTCHKFCSTKNLDKLKEFNDFTVFENFEEVEFNAPESKAIWLEEKEYLRETVQNTLLGRISTLTGTDEGWLERASKQQYEYFELFSILATEEDVCHWIETMRESDQLIELIGYTVFKRTHSLDKYSQEELNKIKLIAKKIRSKSTSNPIKFSCIYVIYKLGNNDIIEPVFKVKNSEVILYVDMSRRVYSDWNDFETNNKLPECLYCHPYRGEYNKQEGFRVSFSWSPASFVGKKVMGMMDVVGTVRTIGSAAATGAAVALNTASSAAAAVGGSVATLTSSAYGLSKGVVNVLYTAVSVAGLVPTLATQGSAIFTQALTECEDNNNLPPKSGDLPMKTLLFFNSNSPEEAIEKIRELYEVAPNKSSVFTIKSFVIANSVQSVSMGRVEKFISKPLATLALDLLDKVEGMEKSNYVDTLFLTDIFCYGEFTSLNRAFTDADEIIRTDFFTVLMDTVCKTSSGCVAPVSLRSYRGVEFYHVSEIFKQIDFGVVAKGCFTIAKFLDSVTFKKLQTYVINILTLICSGDRDRADCLLHLNDYSNLLKSPEIKSALISSKKVKKVRFENS